MTKLTALTGSECLPVKLHVMPDLIDRSEVLNNRECSREGHNSCLSELDKIGVEVDVEKLYAVIKANSGEAASPFGWRKQMATALASDLSWLRLKKEDV